MRRWLLLGVTLAVLAAAVVVAVGAGGSTRLDCGPEGKPTLGGNACIDRHPVTIP